MDCRCIALGGTGGVHDDLRIAYPLGAERAPHARGLSLVYGLETKERLLDVNNLEITSTLGDERSTDDISRYSIERGSLLNAGGSNQNEQKGIAL